MNVTEFEIDGIKYKASKLPPQKQMRIAKRLLPVMEGLLTPEFLASVRQQEGKVVVDPNAVLPAVMNALRRMTDEDMDVLCDECLKVVQRQDTTAWANIVTPGGALLYQDIELPQMVQIVWHVVEANLMSFFGTSQPRVELGQAKA